MIQVLFSPLRPYTPTWRQGAGEGEAIKYVFQILSAVIHFRARNLVFLSAHVIDCIFPPSELMHIFPYSSPGLSFRVSRLHFLSHVTDYICFLRIPSVACLSVFFSHPLRC